MVKEEDRATLDFEITAPLVWLAPKVNKGYIWLSNVKNRKHNCILTKTVKKDILYWQREWDKLGEEKQKEVVAVSAITKSYNRLSKNGKWLFLKEIKG